MSQALSSDLMEDLRSVAAAMRQSHQTLFLSKFEAVDAEALKSSSAWHSAPRL